MDQDIDEILEIVPPTDSAKSKDEIREAKEQELQRCPACKQRLDASNDFVCSKCKKIVWRNIKGELYGSLGAIVVGVLFRLTDDDFLNSIATVLLVGGIFLAWRTIRVLMSSETKM